MSGPGPLAAVTGRAAAAAADCGEDDTTDGNVPATEAAKRNKYTAYYYHYMQIYVVLTGRPVPRLSDNENETLLRMFTAIIEPYRMYCGPRTNFLSYKVCLYRMCEMRGHTALLENFVLLKGKKNVAVQDAVLKRVFSYLKWAFPAWGLVGGGADPVAAVGDPAALLAAAAAAAPKRSAVPGNMQSPLMAFARKAKEKKKEAASAAAAVTAAPPIFDRKI